MERKSSNSSVIAVYDSISFSGLEVAQYVIFQIHLRARLSSRFVFGDFITIHHFVVVTLFSNDISVRSYLRYLA